jgi:hypothetical protein
MWKRDSGYRQVYKLNNRERACNSCENVERSEGNNYQVKYFCHEHGLYIRPNYICREYDKEVLDKKTYEKL